MDAILVELQTTVVGDVIAKKTDHTSGVSAEANAVRQKWKAITRKKEKLDKKLIL